MKEYTLLSLLALTINYALPDAYLVERFVFLAIFSLHWDTLHWVHAKRAVWLRSGSNIAEVEYRPLTPAKQSASD